MLNEIEDQVTSSNQPLTENSIYKSLAAEDGKDEEVEEVPELKEEVEEEVKEETEEESETSDDDDEDKEKLELSDDEEEESFTYDRVPPRKVINEKFPELFKTFPGIDKALQREHAYAEAFPTVPEAREAKQRLDVFARVQNDLFSGNIGDLLVSIKNQDSNAFNSIADNLPETLAKVDRAAYFKTADYFTKYLLSAASSKAKEIGGEDGEQLEIAARLINKFVYNSDKIEGPSKNTEQQKEDPRAKEIADRERKFEEREFTAALSNVTTRIDRTIRAKVEQYIDPKGLMTDYVKKTAITEVINGIEKDIATDTRFRAHLDRLWAKAKADGYPEEALKGIRQAILSQASNSLDPHIRKVRANALKGRSSQNNSNRKNEDEKPEKLTRRQASPEERSSSGKKDSRMPTKVGSVRDVMKALENA